jgi:hypothetical protein
VAFTGQGGAWTRPSPPRSPAGTTSPCSEGQRAVRALANRSFVGFLYVLVIAGLLLVPHLSPASAAVALGCMGALGLLHAGGDLLVVAGEQGAARRALARRNALLAVGALLWRGRLGTLYGLPWVTMALLGAATQNAWVLLSVAHPPGQDA